MKTRQLLKTACLILSACTNINIDFLAKLHTEDILLLIKQQIYWIPAEKSGIGKIL